MPFIQTSRKPCQHSLVVFLNGYGFVKQLMMLWPANGEYLGQAVRRNGAVFARKLAGAFVTDTEGGTACITFAAQHQTPGFLQAQLFLKLQRCDAGYTAEMSMKAGKAHLYIFSQGLHG